MAPTDVFFILYLFVLLPILAVRTARRIQKGGISVKLTARTRLMTLFVHGWMLLLAILSASAGGMVLQFRPADIGRASIWSALLLIVGGLWLAHRWRSTERTDSLLPGEQLAPHGTTLWTLWILTSCSAGVAEEIVYRGVGTTMLSWYVGGMIPAALISAVSFGLVHATQGRRGMLVTGAFGLLAQGLVAVTGALGPAIAVHILYDVAAGWMLSRKYPMRNRQSSGAALA
jgi:membrane protease YdiL (CAAX protease family)